MTSTHPMISEGVTFIRRANLWVYYRCYNFKDAPDVKEYFSTEEQARQKLEAEKAKRQPQISTP